MIMVPIYCSQLFTSEDILRYNNKGKAEIVGAISSTGNATTNGAKYKHKHPIGSPSNISRRSIPEIVTMAWKVWRRVRCESD